MFSDLCKSRTQDVVVVPMLNRLFFIVVFRVVLEILISGTSRWRTGEQEEVSKNVKGGIEA